MLHSGASARENGGRLFPEPHAIQRRGLPNALNRRWFRVGPCLDNLAPSALRQPEIAGYRRSWKRRKVLDIRCQIVALVFDRMLRSERGALLFIEAIDFFTDPRQALRSHP